jgi:hypothetical protein
MLRRKLGLRIILRKERVSGQHGAEEGQSRGLEFFPKDMTWEVSIHDLFAN